MEKQVLKLDKVSLSPELLSCIENLQESSGSEQNYWLNNLVERLSALGDLVVQYYLNDPTAIKQNVCMESLTDIKIIKDVLRDLAAQLLIEDQLNN